MSKAFGSCNGKVHESDESKEVGAETIHGKGKNSMENSNLEASPNSDSQGFIGYGESSLVFCRQLRQSPAFERS